MLAALASALHRARFTPAALQALWGTDADAALRENDPAPAARHCRRVLTSAGSSGDRRLAAIALLFHLDSPVPAEYVIEALGEDLVASLQGGGLLVTAEAEAGVEGDSAAEAGAGDAAMAGADPEAGAGAGAEVAAGAAAGAGHDDAAPQLLCSVLALICHPLPVGVPRGIMPGDDTLLLVADHGTLTQIGRAHV